MKYKFSSKILVYPGPSSWRFLVLPKKEAGEIKEWLGRSAKAWGSISVSATVGRTDWKTSIFPDKKSGTYLLPLKAEVRRRENIDDRDEISFELKFKQ